VPVVPTMRQNCLGLESPAILRVKSRYESRHRLPPKRASPTQWAKWCPPPHPPKPSINIPAETDVLYPGSTPCAFISLKTKHCPFSQAGCLVLACESKIFSTQSRIPGATSGVTPISWFSGRPLPDGHASRLPLRGRRRVSGGAQESRLGRGGCERHWLARDTAW